MRMPPLESWHFAVVVDGLRCGRCLLTADLYPFMAAMANRHRSLVMLPWQLTDNRPNIGVDIHPLVP